MRLRALPKSALLAVLATAPFCTHAAETAAIQADPIADNLYVLAAERGNMALLVGEEGALLVDTQSAPLTPELLSSIAAVTDKPVRFLVNTHFHPDHAGGNATFGESGAVIVAHENTFHRLSTESASGASGAAVPAQSRHAWPTVTFGHSLSLHVNGEDIELVHAPGAHTDSDVVVYFRKANVVHTGDVFAGPSYPMIDTGAGGSLDGVIAGTAAILSRIDRDTRIIPGHAPVQGRADLEAFRGMLVTVRRRIAAAIQAGQSEDEVAMAGLTREFDAKYAPVPGDSSSTEAFLRGAYRDLERYVKSGRR